MARLLNAGHAIFSPPSGIFKWEGLHTPDHLINAGNSCFFFTKYVSTKGARRQVQGGALALPRILPLIIFTEHYSCTKCNTETPPRQSLSYRMKYDNRCWCSTSRKIETRQICPSTLRWPLGLHPLEKFLRAPMVSASIRSTLPLGEFPGLWLALVSDAVVTEEE